MVDLVRSVAAPGTSQRAKAKLTGKSYILQEEGVSTEGGADIMCVHVRGKIKDFLYPV